MLVNNSSSNSNSFTISLLNYLFAGLHGKYVYLKALQELNVSEYQEQEERLSSPGGELAEHKGVEQSNYSIEEKIQLVEGWITQLINEKISLFDLDWKEPKTENAKLAISIGKALIKDLDTHSIILQDVLRQKDFDNISRPNLGLLLSSLMRFHRSREIYVKTFRQYYEKSSEKHLVKQYREEFKSCQKNSRYTEKLIAAFMTPRTLSTEYYHSLYEEVIALPGIWRTQMHDLEMLCRVYEKLFTYEDAGCQEGEGSLWEQLGVTPQEAGHWRAYSITPQEAHVWIANGVPEHQVAGTWKAWGYPPEDALHWIQAQFSSPAEATPWANSGFDPSEAMQLIERGVSDPSMIR